MEKFVIAFKAMDLKIVKLLNKKNNSSVLKSPLIDLL